MKKCTDCDYEVPDGQDLCYLCWRDNQKILYPELYEPDSIFPRNGKTPNQVDLKELYQ